MIQRAQYFLSTTGLFPVRRKIVEHKMQMSSLRVFKCWIQSWSVLKQYQGICGQGKYGKS